MPAVAAVARRVVIWWDEDVLVDVESRVRAELGDAVAGTGSPAVVADRLCHACVELFGVDGASIALTADRANQGTLGASSPLSRRLDELQFTYGEGPCLDATESDRPVLTADLGEVSDRQWPVYTGAVLDAGVGAVFALPVRLAAQPVGALDLYRGRRGPLSRASMAGALLAAELAAVPLLDLMAVHADWSAAGEPEDGWARLASLERVEVYQATGMIMGLVGVDATEALVRLRARAFTTGVTTGELAWQIVERRVALDPVDWQDRPDAERGR